MSDIAVRLPDETSKASPHHQASLEMWSALKLATESPSHRAAWKDTALIVGVAQSDDRWFDDGGQS